MKNLFFGIIATLLFNVFSFAETNENNQNPVQITVLESDYNVVSALINESLQVWSKTSYTSFFNPDIILLAEKSSMTNEEIERFKALYNEGYQVMLNSNPKLKSAYNDFVALKLSTQDLQTNIDRFNSEHPLTSLNYNRALIPNKKACAVATAASILCDFGQSQYCWGFIGVWVHC